MTNSDTLDTDIHDLSLGAIHALSILDVKILSYLQLRRLGAALDNALESVSKETMLRAASENGGDTVRVPSPRIDQPL
jgi:hypothetical protein